MIETPAVKALVVACALTALRLGAVGAPSGPSPIQAVTYPAYGIDEPPQPIKKDAPEYPTSLIDSGNSGEVLLEAVVDTHGDVQTVWVIRSSHPDFEAPAIEAILTWKFKPGIRQGVAVSTYLQIPVQFIYQGLHGFGAQPWNIPPTGSKKLPPVYQYDSPPKPMLTTAPVYPFELLQQNIKGSAKVAFIIDPTGRTRRIVVREASRPEFGAATAAMIAAWEFSPAKKDGKKSWAMLGKEQLFNRSDRDAGLNDSSLRLLRALKKDPCPILKSLKDLDAALVPRSRPGPVTPFALLTDNVPAEATIEFIIDHAGHAQLPRIVSSTRDDFGWAAATAVARWLFSVPMKDGHPVDVFAQIPINYVPPPKDG